MFPQVCVIHSVHGGVCVPACNWAWGVYLSMQWDRGCTSSWTPPRHTPPGHTYPSEHTPLNTHPNTHTPGHPPRTHTPHPERWPLKRAVRILLECTLVNCLILKNKVHDILTLKRENVKKKRIHQIKVGGTEIKRIVYKHFR